MRMDSHIPSKTLLVFLLLVGFLGASSGTLSSSTEDASYASRYRSLERLHHDVTSISNTTTQDELFDFADSLDVLKNLFSLPSLLKRKYQLRSTQDELLQQNISETCVNNTMQIVEGLLRREGWALKMLDAAGKPASGLMEGNLYWFGSYDECWTIHASSINDSSVDFDGRYCKMGIGAPHAKVPFGIAGALTVTYGVCLPNSCSGEDAEVMFNTLIGLATGTQRLPVQNRTVQVFTSECKLQPADLEWTGGAIAALCVLSLFTFLLIIGTIYDILHQHTGIFKNRPKLYMSEKHIINQSADGSTVENGETISSASVDVKQSGEVGKYSKMSDPGQQQKPGILHNVIVAFSVYTNGVKMLGTAQPEGSLRAVHGIRFISMSWVILGHTFFFLLTSQTLGNIAPYYQMMLERWTAQAILNATVSVDTFFVLSGVLLSYLFMREMGKMGGPRKVNWFMFYFHRYWRLTPPYMLVMLMYVPLYRYWSEGPQYPQAAYGIDVNCPKYWWTNILYINNLVHSSQQCMGWSWYLANDMQFFIISPIILLAFYFNAAAGGVVTAALVLMNFIASGVITTENNAQATFIAMADISDKIYWKPWCRIGPYALGIALGYILHVNKCKVKKGLMTNVIMVVGWCIAIVLGILVVYGLYDDYDGSVSPQAVASLYNATARTGWGLAVCWVIFACVTGYGGFVNMFLSWKGFIPLSRLTYCAYLVHPVIMTVYYTSLRAPYIATDTMLIYSFFGHLVAAYVIAFATSLLFESPMIGLERALFRK
ncbi:nose resistant to fluoxetine protein 6-like [Lineus longissimus]|uniref:nose resistant to fluoxetine protein 6-like n=1 Tax=Lineus longissimus TaxID=88925 RepID=UPI002B4C58E3